MASIGQSLRHSISKLTIATSHWTSRIKESVSEFLKKAKALINELEGSWRKIQCAEFSAITYRNIGSDYHSIISTPNLVPEPVSFFELYSQLVAHAIVLKSSQESTLANIASKPATDHTTLSYFNSSNAFQTPLNYALQFYPRPCGFIAPFRSPMPYRPSNNIAYQICGLFNHIIDWCWKRYTPHQNGSQSPRQVNYNTYGPHLSQYNSNDLISWYSNTKANFHTIPDVTNLQTVTTYHGNNQLHVGNG